MSKSRFFEGLIIGSIIGVIGTVLFSNVDCEEACIPKKADDEKDDVSKKEDAKKVSTEKMVDKTLDAIEQGFDKISSMIDDKNKPKKK